MSVKITLTSQPRGRDPAAAAGEQAARADGNRRGGGRRGGRDRHQRESVGGGVAGVVRCGRGRGR